MKISWKLIEDYSKVITCNLFLYAEHQFKAMPYISDIRVYYNSKVEVYLQPSRNAALQGGGLSAPRFGRFTPEETRYPLYRRLFGPVWTARKISPPPGFHPRTIQSVASRCTDYTIPAQNTVFLAP